MANRQNISRADRVKHPRAVERPVGGMALRTAPVSSSRVLLIAGQPLNEPIAQHGPFVMNTQ